MAKMLYVPAANVFIKDKNLSYNAKSIMIIMMFLAHKGIVKNKSIRKLASISGFNKKTTQKHLRQLEENGYISKVKCYRYSLTLGRPINDINCYKLNISTDGGYTLIPRSVLKLKKSGTCFVVLMYLYLCAGRDGRAFPSLQHIAGVRKDEKGGCGVSLRSVCRALKVLEKLGCIIKIPCHAKCGDFSCNSYLLTDMVRKNASASKQIPQSSALSTSASEKQQEFSTEGTAKIGSTGFINKITGGYIMREEDKGVGEFGDLYSFLDDMLCAGVSVPVLTMNTA